MESADLEAARVNQYPRRPPAWCADFLGQDTKDKALAGDFKIPGFSLPANMPPAELLEKTPELPQLKVAIWKHLQISILCAWYKKLIPVSMLDKPNNKNGLIGVLL